jgi:hypothetical protein
MADSDLIFSIIAQDQYKQQFEEARAAVDRMTQAEKDALALKAPVYEAEKKIGDALSQSTTAAQKYGDAFNDLKQKYIDGKIPQDEYIKGLAELGQKMEDTKSFGSTFAQTLTGIQSGISIAKEAIGGLKEVWDFAKQGAENQQIAASFERTAKSIGGNAGEIVSALDAAAKGTVDDEELMQASTRALTLGVAKNGDDLVKVMQLARSAALAFGGDTGQAFETINYAIGNLAPRALKQFGIVVNLKEANDAYAKSLGVTADSLTEEQQRQALLNAVLEQGTKNFGDIAGAATTTAEKMKAVETRLANILDVVKEVAATGIGTALDISDAPGNFLKAFTETAAKMRVEVAAGRMSAVDYNNALAGMAQGLRDNGFVLPVVTYNAQLLNTTIDASAKGAYGFAGALDESNRAGRRAADGAAALVIQEQLLKQAQENAGQGAYAFNGALDESNRALMRTKESAANVTGIMDELKVGMAGQLQNEFTSFNNKQDDLATKAAKVKEELEKLQATQGRAITTTSKHALTSNEATLAQLQLEKAQRELNTETSKGNLTADEQAALEAKVALNKEKLDGVTKTQISSSKQLTAAQQALKDAQAELNNNTDPLKQAKLAVEVDNLKEKLGQATGAVGKYVDNSKRIKELQGQYDEITKEVEANAKAHEDATRRILFGYAEQQLAVGGVTETEAKALDALAVKWGLKSQEDINAMQAIRDAAAGLAEDGSIDKFVGSLSDSLDTAEGKLTETQQHVVDVAAGLTHGAPINFQVGADPKPAETDVDNAKKKIAETPLVIKAQVSIGEQIKGAAGDTLAERAAQVRTQNDAIKGTTQNVFNATDLITNYAKDAMTSTGKVADTATSQVNSLADKTKVKFGDVSTSVINALTNMATVATSDLNQVQNYIDKLPTFKEFTYSIKVKGGDDIPSQRGAIGGADYFVPPNPRGGSGDYYPVIAAPGEHVVITPAGATGQSAKPGQAQTNVTNNNTYNLFDALAAKQVTEQQRLERIKSVVGAM